MPAGRPSVRTVLRLAEDGSRNTKRRKFSLRMASLETTLSREFAEDVGRAFQDGRAPTQKWLAHARGVVTRELRLFGREAVAPVFKGFAPERDWGGNGPNGRSKKLRDTIEAVVQRRKDSSASLRLNMGWWGWYTVEGRDALEPKPLPRQPGNEVYKIVLPGGGVIFRRAVGPATTRALSAARKMRINGRTHVLNVPPLDAARAKERMEWPKRAWEVLIKAGFRKDLVENIAVSILKGQSSREGMYTVYNMGTSPATMNYIRTGSTHFANETRNMRSAEKEAKQRRRKEKRERLRAEREAGITNKPKKGGGSLSSAQSRAEREAERAREVRREHHILELQDHLLRAGRRLEEARNGVKVATERVQRDNTFTNRQKLTEARRRFDLARKEHNNIDNQLYELVGDE